jgi:hypothetical protein
VQTSEQQHELASSPVKCLLNKLQAQMRTINACLAVVLLLLLCCACYTYGRVLEA